MAYKRKRATMPYRARGGMYKRRKTFVKRRFGGSRYPARMRQLSRRTFAKRRRVQRMLRPVTETKLVALVKQNEVQPVAIQTGIGVQATFIAFTLGTQSAFSGDTPVGGIAMAQGVGRANRIGAYVNYKKTTASIRVEMNAGSNAPPIQMRMIVFKARRSNNPAGISPSWASSGFIDNDGANTGHGEDGINGLDLMQLITNKRQWVIYKDTKFILQPYNDFAGGETSIIYSHYPAAKEVLLTLPHYGKAHYPNSGSLTPDDLDTRYTVIIYGHSLGRSGIVANAYEASIRGTTTFTDI